MKDVYAVMASKVFNKPYEYCLEYKDDEPYFEGQCRRKAVKFAILEEYTKRTNEPMWNLLCIEFPVLKVMPTYHDTDDSQFSLIDWLRDNISE